MALSRTNSNGLKAVVVVLSFLFAIHPSKSVGLVLSKSAESFKQNKHVLGSRPPQCANKCWSCKPCRATLVIPPHMKTTSKVPLRDPDESYYLLLWKCRCGNKLFQP